jgi:hypothetical protein
LALVPASRFGGVPEWLKGADCKSAGVRLRWFESNPLHQSSVKGLIRKNISLNQTVRGARVIQNGGTNACNDSALSGQGGNGGQT